MKIKKKFRVLTIKRGFITVYQAQMKNRFRWKSFYCKSDGVCSFFYNPTTDKEWEYNSIENYRRSQGWKKNEIEIE